MSKQKKKYTVYDIPLKFDLHGALMQQRSLDNAFEQGFIEGDKNAVELAVKVGQMAQKQVINQAKPVIKGLKNQIVDQKQLVQDFEKIGQYPYVYFNEIDNDLKPASSLQEVFEQIENIHSEKFHTSEKTGTGQIRAKKLPLQQWSNFKVNFKDSGGSANVQIYKQFNTGKNAEIAKNMYQTRILNRIIELPKIPNPKIVIP